MKEERQHILNQLLQDNDIDPKRIKTIFKVGNPVKDLLDIGIAENVDMIIMGIKARTGLENVLIGSVHYNSSCSLQTKLKQNFKSFVIS